MTSLFDWAAGQPQSSPPRLIAPHNSSERDPAVTPGRHGGEAIHLLCVTTRTARTGCGKRISAYYPQSKTALLAIGDGVLKCTPERDDVTCRECRND
jgi:hypothetical protein